MSSFKFYFVIFLLNFVYVRAGISDKRLCANEDCSEVISLAKTLLKYASPEEGILSFLPQTDVKVLSKSAGSNLNLWGVEINGKRGYVPNHMIREYKKIYKGDLKFLVDTDLSGKEKSEVPSTVDSEKIIPTNVNKPYEVVDGTTIYLSPDESFQPPSPVTEEPKIADEPNKHKTDEVNKDVNNNNVEVDTTNKAESNIESKEESAELETDDMNKKEGSFVKNIVSSFSNWIGSEGSGNDLDLEDDDEDLDSEEDDDDDADEEEDDYEDEVEANNKNADNNIKIATDDLVKSQPEIPAELPSNSEETANQDQKNIQFESKREQVINEDLPKNENAPNEVKIEDVIPPVQIISQPNVPPTPPENPPLEILQNDAIGSTPNEVPKTDIPSSAQPDLPLVEVQTIEIPATPQPDVINTPPDQVPIPTNTINPLPIQIQNVEIPISVHSDNSNIPPLQVENTDSPITTQTDASNTPIQAEQSDSSMNVEADSIIIPPNQLKQTENPIPVAPEPADSIQQTQPLIGENTESVQDKIPMTTETPLDIPKPVEIDIETVTQPSTTIVEDKPQVLLENATPGKGTEDITKPQDLVNNIGDTKLENDNILSDTKDSPEMTVEETSNEVKESSASTSVPIEKIDISFDETLKEKQPLEEGIAVNESSNIEPLSSNTESTEEVDPPKGGMFDGMFSGLFGQTEQQDQTENSKEESSKESSEINNEVEKEVQNENDFVINDTSTEQLNSNEETLNEIPQINENVGAENINNLEQINSNEENNYGAQNSWLFPPPARESDASEDHHDNLVSKQVDDAATCEMNPETSYCKTEEREELGQTYKEMMNFDFSKLYNLIVAMLTTVIALTIYFWGFTFIDKRKREFRFVARINELEKLLLVEAKQNQILNEKLENPEVVQQYEDAISLEEVEALRAELEELQSMKCALEEQVQSLEQELENSTEVGLELNRMISDMFSSQNGSDTLIANVEHLQRQLIEQQSTINSINNTLSIKDTENHELQLELEIRNKKLTDLQAEYVTLVSNLSEMEEDKDQLQSKLESDIAALKEQLGKLTSTATAEKTKFTEEINQLKKHCGDLQRNYDVKSNEYNLLKDTVQEIKSGRNNNENIKSMLDVNSLKAELQQLQRDNKILAEHLQQEEQIKYELEKKADVSMQEVRLLKQKYDESDREKLEAQTKLEVLSNYFTEKEKELQKELSKQESMWVEKQGEATSVTERIKYMQDELQNYKSLNESLKQEIVSQEVQLKSQITILEKKAHDSWVEARQAERKLEMAKQEAAQLRNRLTLRSLNEEKLQNRLQSPIEHNGELPVSPLHMQGETPASPPLLYGARDHLTTSPPLPPPGLPPFLPPPPGVPFMPPPMPGVPPFMPPPPNMFPGDHRPPPLGRMSSPPINSRYSPDSRAYSPYDDRNSPSPSYDDEYGSSPPLHRSYNSYDREDRRNIRRPAPVRNNIRHNKGSNVSSGSGHSNESLEKINRHHPKV